MAICEECNQEMSGDSPATACRTRGRVTFPNGLSLPALTKHFSEASGRCHDCNVKHGSYHHPGCDVERCPRCDGHLMTCGCLDEEEDE